MSYANALGFQWPASFIDFLKGSHKILAAATVLWKGSPRCPKRAVHCREAPQFTLLQFLCERNPASHVLNCVSLPSKDQGLGRHGMLPNCLVTETVSACFAWHSIQAVRSCIVLAAAAQKNCYANFRIEQPASARATVLWVGSHNTRVRIMLAT